MNRTMLLPTLARFLCIASNSSSDVIVQRLGNLKYDTGKTRQPGKMRRRKSFGMSMMTVVAMFKSDPLVAAVNERLGDADPACFPIPCDADIAQEFIHESKPFDGKTGNLDKLLRADSTNGQT